MEQAHAGYSRLAGFPSPAGGALSGTGEFRVKGQFNWFNGVLQGNGRTVFTNSAVVELRSGVIVSRTIDNYSNPGAHLRMEVPDS